MTRERPVTEADQRPKGRRWGRLGDLLFRGLTGASAVSVLVIFGLSVYLLYLTAEPSLVQWGPGFLVGQTWNPQATQLNPEVFGGLPAIVGTLETSLIAMAIAIPLSLGIAIFLTELSPGFLRGPLSFLVELLAAIPSIVYGIWGALFLVPYMASNVDPALAGTIGQVPVIGTPFAANAYYTGVGTLTAGVILAIMCIPTISAVSREAFKAVPNEQREAALSLGATRWETTRLAVLGNSKRGVIGGITLGLGRAIGETIAVVLVVGNSYTISQSLYRPAVTMASWIAAQWGNSLGGARPALIELGLVLMAMSIIVNVVARLILGRGIFTEGMGT